MSMQSIQSESPLLVVGLGSVGQRHARNLRSLCSRSLILLSTGKGSLAREEYEDSIVVDNIEHALRYKPGAAVISNPTSLHVSAAIPAAAEGCHLFIEKPVSDSLESAKQLEEFANRFGLKTMVGFQFRFHESLRQVKSWIESDEIGTIVSVSVRWAEYLPDWHPWEDYRQSYTARAELGGGVLLTLCHPFDYLRWLLGEIESVFATMGRLSDLQTDVEDVALVNLKFCSGAIGSVYLDFVQRPPGHNMHIIGTRGVIDWDNSTGVARIYRAGAGEWSSFAPSVGFERNTMFIQEMKYFLDCLENHQPIDCSLAEGIRALEVALAARESAASGRLVYV